MRASSEEFNVTVLSILATRGKMSSDDLRKAIDEKLKTNYSVLTLWTFLTSNFIPRMGKLIAEGLVSGKVEPLEDGKQQSRPNREIFFELTEIGRRKRVDDVYEKQRLNQQSDGPIKEGAVAKWAQGGRSSWTR